jgi:hypothetical protein
MTREQAEEHAAQLNAEHPERASNRWIVKEDQDGWTVARVSLPPGMRIDPVKETTESRPTPPHPADPRSPFEQNVGGLYGAG